MNRIPEGYADCWTPIESNPEIFTELAQNIGLSKSLVFEDIWGLDPDSIALLSRPVLAVVLVFPTGEKYEQNVAAGNIEKPSTTDDNVICLLLSPDLKDKYLKAAQDGDSTVPENAADEVDFHYTCFVKSNGHLYELNGDLSGPVDLGRLNEDEDVLSGAGLGHINRFMQANGDPSSNIGFSMLALAPKHES
ncbi:MAG: hypothetical protein Q9195_008988 [Heterodermia aff. obscurata]